MWESCRSPTIQFLPKTDFNFIHTKKQGPAETQTQTLECKGNHFTSSPSGSKPRSY